MNNSTEGVTLSSAFVKDIIDLYEGKDSYQRELKRMANGLDLSSAMKFVPMETYNSMCNWIESQIGQANTRRLGRKIGATAYSGMLANGLITSDASPKEMMEGLAKVASMMIKDPEGRGWEILETAPKHIIMRRTQTFNSTLQFGLIDELIRKTKAVSPKVEYVKSVADGDEFDEYKISWF
ncbi:hypothetical protein [Marivirga arenosa]|uniref:Uncharacterized protein n=1 Tax=Marivirga arenosa TaxID=3059076 RepID=A0AA49GFB8_9BACT|nr:MULTISPECIES: hypothetical protein [unclassified Marivirga]WKK79295.2 hypothetical protein QYS47_17860 [Marivirga sp. BKB1-2]WKK85615.2 hypothetical protein QYS48_00425 [Marivirga sp. ABR2-2]